MPAESKSAQFKVGDPVMALPSAYFKAHTGSKQEWFDERIHGERDQRAAPCALLLPMRSSVPLPVSSVALPVRLADVLIWSPRRSLLS